MQYLDSKGELHYPIMGCYGIGVGRLAASVCETHHDEYGPIWPITIAPWQVHLCCLRVDDAETKQFADGLYEELQKEMVEVIYDDRDVRAGVMFSDADLLGVPIRVIVSPRNLQEHCVELVTRDKTVNKKVEQSQIVPTIKELISTMQKAFRS
jgi:prolyl-tRNA synthetase